MSETNIIDHPWDPADEKFDRIAFKKNTEKVERQLLYFREYWYLPWFILGVLGVAFAAAITQAFREVADPRLGFTGRPLLVIFTGLIVLVTHYILSKRALFLKVAIARAHGWTFSSRRSRERWQVLQRKFAPLFDQSTAGILTDEYWGEASKINFWSAHYLYKIDTTIHRKFVLALPVKISHPSELYMKPQTSLRTLDHWIYKNDTNLESIELNKEFGVYGRNEQKADAPEVFGVLTPAVQLALLELKKEVGPFEMALMKNVALFMFDAGNMNNRLSSISLSLNITEKDTDPLSNYLQSMLEKTTKIISYLD